MRSLSEHRITLSACLSVFLSVCPSESGVNLVPGSEGKSVYPRTTRRGAAPLGYFNLVWNACLTAPDKVKIYSRTK